MSNMSNKVRFNPVQCTEDVLERLAPTPGYVYFTTDTKKIYLGTDDKKLPMCAATGFFYGIKEIEYVNDGLPPDPNVLFLFDEIEGEDIPEIDDLILNIDGCFYRVKEVNVETEEVETVRLTLQGTGGGGGSSGGGGTNFTLVADKKSYTFSSEDTNMTIAVRGNYTGTEENYISTIEVKLLGEDIPFCILEGPYAFGQLISIDLAKYKHLFSKEQEIKVYAEDMYGSIRETKTITIHTVELVLTQIQENLLVSFTDTYDYRYTVSGTTSGINEKILNFNFYEENNLTAPVYTVTHTLKGDYVGSTTYPLNVSALNHQSYILKVALSVDLNGDGKPDVWSNTLTHKIACFKTNNNSPILQVSIPEETQAYTNIPINYLLSTNESEKPYTMKISLNGKEKAILDITSNVIGSYDLYFEETGVYTLRCEILEFGITFETILNIAKYDGEIPVIDPTSPDLMLYLNPKGKINNAIDRNEWKDYNGRYTGILEGLHYGNTDGWLTDENGTSFLKLSSGAKFLLPDFKPFAVDPTEGINLGMTIEIDFEVNGVLNYNSQLIKCLSTDGYFTQVGFTISGEQINLYNSRLNGRDEATGSLLSLNIVEGKRIRASFVIEPKAIKRPGITDTNKNFPMCRIYIDGILSGTVIYDKSDKFLDSRINPALLEIDSSDAQIKIYGIRFYKTALDDRNILNNYTATLPTLSSREERYLSNNVFTDNEIDLELLESPGYNLQIPYMKITGGFPTKSDSKWELQDNYSADDARLPTGKKDYRLIDVEVIYPKNTYFTNYNNYKFVNEFENGLTMLEAKGKKPTNGGAIMYAQGTSSMEYPVKNLRLRFNKVKNDTDPKDKNFYRVRPDIEKVEIICMKADYMESSGSHNTGAANLIDAIYDEAGLQTPGQEQFSTASNKIVTCIKGHPCLIFYSPTGEKGSYQYIGKYNLNLDKATPEPFGFKHTEGFGYLPIGESYYEIKYDDDGDIFVGQEDATAGGDYVEGQIETLKQVTEEDKINSIHCFEFLDNNVEICNFQGKMKYQEAIDMTAEKYNNNIEKKYFIQDAEGNYELAKDKFDKETKYYVTILLPYEESWYNGFETPKDGTVPGWTLGFESRYPEDRVGYHDGDSLYPLASWINRLYRLRLKEERIGEPIANKKIKIYRYTLANSYNENNQYFTFNYEKVRLLQAEYENNTEETFYVLNGNDYIEATGDYASDAIYYFRKYKSIDITADNFIADMYYTREAIEERDRESLNRFNAEYQCYFNKDFLFAYYLITEALLMVDSRVKNMMIATWGKEAKSYTDYVTGEVVNTNNYIFYPIFYDMDTMLGLDNTGVFKWTYYSEDTEAGVYNGADILWNFVRDAIPTSELNKYFDKLEGTKLKAQEILPYFNDNQANMASEAFYNGDGKYKYIEPAIYGYKDLLNNKDIQPGEAPYLYALQGNRSLMREWFVINRMRFLRGKRNSSVYQGGDRVVFRWNYPTGSGNDAISNSIAAVPPSGEFTLTSVQTGYAGIQIGANANPYSARFNGSEQKTIVLSADNAGGTEAYLLGLSNLTDLGDLSNKYMQKFVFESAADSTIRLKTLTLGNPHKDYYNPYWKDGTNDIGLSGCIYLENFNLQNCLSYNRALNFTNCPAIETILATGSSVNTISLPKGGQLKELRLPATVTDLTIQDHPSLSSDNFSIGSYQYGPSQTIGEDGNYINNFTLLKSINIQGTAINTYDIIKNSVLLEYYYLPDINWEITANDACYYPVTGTLDTGITYYVNELNVETNTLYFVEYDANNSDHVKKVPKYQKVNFLDENNNIINIAPLDLLKHISPIAGVSKENALKGTITINIPNSKVDELMIYNKYKDIYPNVKILYGNNVSVDEAPEINFYRYGLVRVGGIEPSYDNIDISMLEPYYSVFTDGNTYLSDITYNTDKFINPTMSSTNEKEYAFTGEWVDFNDDNRTKYYQDNIIQSPDNVGKQFSDFKPTKDMDLIPIFDENTHYYTIKFFPVDYKTNPNPIFETYPAWQNPIDSTGNGLQPEAYYLYKDDSGLNEYERYAFRGWISETDANNNVTNPTVYDLTTTKVVSDMNLYPYFEIEDVRYAASDSRLFNFTAVTIDGENGYEIGLSPLYRELASGKLTLPDKYNNKNILAIGDFMNTSTIREIYFLNPNTCAYKRITNNKGFGTGGIYSGFSNIEKIYLPNSITYIGIGAFNNCHYLTTLTLNDNITEFGDMAFRYCHELNLISLPAQLVSIGADGFNGCGKISISHLGSNDNTQKLSRIGIRAFRDAANSVTSLTLGSSVIDIQSDAFSGAYKNVVEIHDYTTYTAEELYSLGLTSGTITDYAIGGE